MRDEIEAAVTWWVERLRNAHNGRQDNGDALQSVMGTMVRDTIPLPSEEKLALFGASLKGRIAERCLGNWDPLDPNTGSYTRTLVTDYGPMGILAQAADEADIHAGLFPWKTVMWVDPGKVEVACGYRAPIVAIYPTGRTSPVRGGVTERKCQCAGGRGQLAREATRGGGRAQKGGL